MALQLPFRFGSKSAETPMESRARQSKMMEYDQPLVWVTLLLMLLGMVMVYSASISLPDSPKFANYVRWQNTYFLQRQMMFIAVSLVVGLFVFRIRIADLQKAAPYLFIGTLVLLVLVLIPGVGVVVNGGRRWLSLKVFNVQPSELMKVVAVLYAADYTVRKQEYMHKLTKGFMPMAAAVAFVGLLLLLEPDLGAFGVIVCIAMGILFLGGINAIWFGGIGAVLVLIFVHHRAVEIPPRALFRVPQSVGRRQRAEQGLPADPLADRFRPRRILALGWAAAWKNCTTCRKPIPTSCWR
jgi:cell division protein FtsW